MDRPSSSNDFTSAHYFPNRRRVLQACVNCRTRKTRCDAAKPRCGLCASQNVECIYKDSQQPRIEHNTRILLERIQHLEDRIFSTGILQQQPRPASASADQVETQPQVEQLEPMTDEQPGDQDVAPDGDSQIQIPLSHTANANHVLNWPFVRQLLKDSPILPASSRGAGDGTAATDIFFQPTTEDEPLSIPPPESWRLFQHDPRHGPPESLDRLRDCIYSYFEEVNVFFPLLSQSDLYSMLERVYAGEVENTAATQMNYLIFYAEYALLLLVLCLGSFVRAEYSRIRLSTMSPPSTNATDAAWSLHDRLWQKSKLLLGYLSSEITLQAAQCAMLAGLYMGACGRVLDSFHWSHAASVKCESLAKKYLVDNEDADTFPETFRRLYWVSYIYEGDFVAEILISLPSGIARYEELVPYPTKGQPSKPMLSAHTPGSEVFTPGSASFDRTEELVPFQISTNAAIRRFLNRIQSVVYDSKDQFRMTRQSYANWLLRISEDLWSHHGAIYRNLPDFLLKSQPLPLQLDPASSPDTPGISAIPELGNNPWNVLRLEGRFYAGQYIIHRPFIEYVLLNLDNFKTHPYREAILQKCRLCLQGCMGFIRVFDKDAANSVTGLFAPGMVTFTMLIILRVAVVCPALRELTPDDVEEVIRIGKRNLKRFGASVKELRWHSEVLDELDAAC